MPMLPFEATPEEILRDPEIYVDSVFSCLESEFLVMLKGAGFVEYPIFEHGYEALKAATNGFSDLNPDKIYSMMIAEPISIIVLRAMLGFTPPEWGYVTTQKTGMQFSQGFVRSLDRKVRMAPETELNTNGVTKERLEAMIQTACQLLSDGAPEVEMNQLHRLNKADTKQGITSIKNVSRIDLPYAMVLYERFLGRPFAGHRDSVSDIIGDSLESAIEDVLTRAAISFRKTKRAERIEGFDQTPDFIIPSEFNPQVIIEAKITEDDGTARDFVLTVKFL